MLEINEGGISNFSIGRLFYDEYESKVVIPLPSDMKKPSFYWNATSSYTAYYASYRSKIDEFYDQVVAFAKRFSSFFSEMDLGVDFRFTCTGRNLHFFFRDQVDAANFASRFPEASEMHVPDSDFDRNTLYGDGSAVCRQFGDKLFHGRYPIKVIFNNRVSGDEIGAWVANQFTNDNERHLFRSSDSQTVLYLADAIDLVLTQLSHETNIKKIEQIV